MPFSNRHQNTAAPEVRVWFNKCFSSVHGILRQLRSGWGPGLVLIGSHTQQDFGPLNECDVVEMEPVGVSEDAYVDWCLDFCQRHSVDVFIPGRMREAVADNKTKFEAQGTRLIVAGDGATLRLLEDKGRFMEEVPEGVAVHSYHRVHNWTEFQAAVQAIEAEGRPACFKPASGTFGIGFYVLDSTLTPLRRLLRSEAHRISLPELQGILESQPSFPELLVMEYLDGSEHSVDVLAHEGAVVAMVCRRKPFNGRVRLSGTSRTEHVTEGQSQSLEEAPEIEAMVRRLVRHFHLGGLLNVQFRSPAERPERPHLLEINGRMSGGLPYVGLSGVNLPLLAICMALRDPSEPEVAIPTALLPLRVQERSEVFAVPSK